MKELYYTIKTLLRTRSSSVIKILSLTFGLFAGILLFAKIASEYRYNTGYRDHQNLYTILTTHTDRDGVKWPSIPAIVAPVPGTLQNDLPDQIECATLINRRSKDRFFLGDKRLTPNIIMADSMFFQTMGIEVLIGNTTELVSPNVLFLSRSFARKAFGDDDPVGKSLMFNKQIEMTIKGIYTDVGENNSLRPEVVISMPTYTHYRMGAYAWRGGDSFRGFARLRPGIGVDAVNSRIDAVIENYLPFEPEKTGIGVQYHLENIQDQYLSESSVKRRISIMSVMGIVLLLVAAMNYILISISSLPGRSKTIGIHKCNGASDGSIFSMFVWETALLIGISLLLVLIMIFNLKSIIQEITETSITSLFTFSTLWVPMLVIFSLFVIAVIFPGKVYASVPVTQVFNRSVSFGQGWKLALLVIQFAGTSFVFGLMCVVMVQYSELMNHEMGYEPDGIFTANYRFRDSETGKRAIESLPMVEGVAVSWQDMGGYLSGDGVFDDNDQRLFTAGINFCDLDYLSLMQLQLKEGRLPSTWGEAIVNEKFIESIKWTDSPLGRQTSGRGNSMGTIVGVVKDFVENSFNQATRPNIIATSQSWGGCVSVRLREPHTENLMKLNEAMLEIFPTEDIVFSSLRQKIDNNYISARRFRDAVIIAFVSIILLTVMGLFGYINDEVRRRSKEIAIRKVNGATTSNILLLLTGRVFWIALPSVIAGATGAYFIGRQWLDQFSGLKIPLNISLFALVAIVILLIIIICAIVRAWRISNENPIKSIKNE